MLALLNLTQPAAAAETATGASGQASAALGISTYSGTDFARDSVGHFAGMTIPLGTGGSQGGFVIRVDGS